MEKISFMAGIFAFFQWLMPMAGWICVHIIVEVFQFFASYIPWIACFLLCFIGVSMVKEGFPVMRDISGPAWEKSAFAARRRDFH